MPQWPHSHYRVDLDRVDWDDVYERVTPDWRRTWHGYTREDIGRWLDDYREVERLIVAGAKREDFERMADSPDPQEQRMWQAYSYGFDPHHRHTDRVTVEWVQGSYRVGDGIHRAVLAREEGLTHLPAIVRAPDQATLDMLQKQDEGSYSRRKPEIDRTQERQRDRRLEREP